MGIGLAMHREILLSSSRPTHVHDKQPHHCTASAPVRGIAAPCAGSESLDVEQEGERQVVSMIFAFREISECKCCVLELTWLYRTSLFVSYSSSGPKSLPSCAAA